MRGDILTYDDGPGTGLISGDDGARYTFTRGDLQQLLPVQAGTRVDFVASDSVATQVFVVAPAATAATGYAPSVAGSGASLDWRALFLDAKGRIAQKDYWIGFGILFAANMVLAWIPFIGILVSIALFYGWACVASKRLHDLGRSGWLVAIPAALFGLACVIMIGTVFGGALSSGYDGGAGMMIGLGSAGLVGTLAFLVNLGFVIWLGVSVGQPGDNAYGPPPVPLAKF